MGSGWYRQALGLVAVVAALVSLALGGDGALRIGVAATSVGVLALVGYFSPWFEQEWPLDGKDGWFLTGAVLTTIGLPLVAIGAVIQFAV